jgi:hypothetical protein
MQTQSAAINLSAADWNIHPSRKVICEDPKGQLVNPSSWRLMG